jgi:hypothetical protein
MADKKESDQCRGEGDPNTRYHKMSSTHQVLDRTENVVVITYECLNCGIKVKTSTPAVVIGP